jgi:ABC-2 type transport system ATP-binding protein
MGIQIRTARATPQQATNDAAPTDVAITTVGLTKRYGTTTVVDHLSLQVRRGEIYGFLGLNGAGKTTTIRMLLGMIRPSGGSAQMLGMRAHAGAHALWARVGYLVETPYAYPELTVRENLDIIRRLRHVSDTQAVDRTMAQLALTPYARRRAGTLSLGTAQRLGLAKALLHAPDLLVLDEPANALDPAGVAEVRDLLRDVAHHHGVTVFMSSHILSEVARTATRIGIIHAGQLVEEVNAEALAQRRYRSLVLDARDREAARATLHAAGFMISTTAQGRLLVREERAVTHPDEIVRLLVGAGVPPTHVSVEQEDLETHFFRLVGAHKEHQHA